MQKAFPLARVFSELERRYNVQWKAYFVDFWYCSYIFCKACKYLTTIALWQKVKKLFLTTRNLCNHYRKLCVCVRVCRCAVVHSISTSRGHQQKFNHLLARINSYHHSFLPATIRKWNSLPRDVVNSSDIQEFTNNLYMHAYTHI